MTTGAFTVSLDTELAWGSFDMGGIVEHEAAYRETPAVVERLCDLFETYGVAATWAFVAHLFEDCAGHDDADPPERARWLADAPCQRDIDRALWFAPGLLEMVRECDVEHDVALHGYSHLILGECSRRAADAELSAAVRAARNAGIDPTSWVFPRNDIDHVDLLSAHGFEVYRGRDARWYERRPVPSVGRKPLRFLDEALARRPPTVVPTMHNGVVRVPGSQVFRPEHGPWARTPSGTQRDRAIDGLERAAERGEIFHLWFHPFNLGRETDAAVALLESILERAAALEARDEIDIMPLSDVATEYRDGRWRSSVESTAQREAT